MRRTIGTFAVASATAVALMAGPVVTSAQADDRPAPAGQSVRVATYNILKATGAGGKRAWTKRRAALTRVVNATTPDVLLIQEASTKKWRGVRHIDDVNRVLWNAGYRITSTDYDSCTAGCTRGAHIFYNPARMRMPALPTGAPASGMAGISTVGLMAFGGVQDRNASWAFLTPADSPRTSLYISVHLPSDKTAFAEELRLAVARQLRPWADGLIQASGLSGVEIVVGGDLNSYELRQPFGAQHALSSAGLIDGYTAPVKVNPNFGTINYTPSTQKYKGFPPKPYFYRYIIPTRIDYVFSTVPAERHEVVLFLKRNGKFMNKYRVSDHNMVMVDLPLR